MSEQFTEIRELMLSMVTNTASGAIEFLPKLIGAMFVLFVGWLFARLVKAVVSRSIRVGLDSLLERTGVTRALESTNMTAAPSEIVSRVLYWLLMIMVIMAASEIVGLTAVSSAIQQILSYIPNVISAALVLAAGVFLSRFVGNLVTSAGTAAELSYAKGLGAVASTSIVVMVGVVTLQQLGVDTQILITVITVTVASITAGMGLAFALGAREVVRAILAGHYLRQTLPPGGSVEVAGAQGVLEQVGPIATTVRDGEQSWSVPNTRLMDEVVRM